MKIYTVIIQGITSDGHHQNSVENFETFDKAKKFIDDCVEAQKSLEGEDSFVPYDMTGEAYEMGWIFRGKVLYGVETRHTNTGKPFHMYGEKRFVIETELQ